MLRLVIWPSMMLLTSALLIYFQELFNRHRALIIGSGVIGLTTAYLLLERGSVRRKVIWLYNRGIGGSETPASCNSISKLPPLSILIYYVPVNFILKIFVDYKLFLLWSSDWSLKVVVLWWKNHFLFFFGFWKRIRLTSNWQNFELCVLSEGCLFWV